MIPLIKLLGSKKILKIINKMSYLGHFNQKVTIKKRKYFLMGISAD